MTDGRTDGESGTDGFIIAKSPSFAHVTLTVVPIADLTPTVSFRHFETIHFNKLSPLRSTVEIVSCLLTVLRLVFFVLVLNLVLQDRFKEN